jgi:hypothetical protein
MCRYGVDVRNQKDNPDHYQRLAAVRADQNQFPAGPSDDEENTDKKAQNLPSHIYALLSLEPSSRFLIVFATLDIVAALILEFSVQMSFDIIFYFHASVCHKTHL